MRNNNNPISSLIMSIIIFVLVSTFFRFIMFIPGVRLIVSLVFLIAPILIFLFIRRKLANIKGQFGKNFNEANWRGYDGNTQESMGDYGTKDYGAEYGNFRNGKQNQNNKEEIIAEVLEVKDLDKEE